MTGTLITRNIMVNTKRGVTEYPSFRNCPPYLRFCCWSRKLVILCGRPVVSWFYFTPGESNIKPIRDDEVGWT
jgi:hypothetical protein